MRRGAARQRTDARAVLRRRLSCYGAETIATRLRMGDSQVANAREELLRFDLIAYVPPLTQVLSLPADRFDQERARLRPLPALAFDTDEGVLSASMYFSESRQFFGD